MPVQRICFPSSRVDQARRVRSSEIQSILIELNGLRHVLANIAARLDSVERAPSMDSRTPCHLLHVPTPAHVATPSRHWQLKDLRRAHGWSQTGLMCRIRDAATEMGLRIPEPSSLRTMISRWENGAPVGEFYSSILDRVFPPSEMLPAVAL